MKMMRDIQCVLPGVKEDVVISTPLVNNYRQWLAESFTSKA